MSNIIISVIMPVFNGEKYLDKVIQSFVKQEYPFKELLIVDGKSTDSSHEIIQNHVIKNPNIKWIKYTDTGIVDAYNKGLSEAKGDIIGYLGCDDMIFDQLFNTIILYTKYFDFDALYFDSYTYYIKERRCIYRKCPEIEFNRKNLLEYGTIVGFQNIYFKRNILEKYKLNPNNKWSFDYEYYLSIVENNLLFVNAKSIATIDIFDNNISSDTNQIQYQESVKVAKYFCRPGDKVFYKKSNIIEKFITYLKNLN